MFAQGKVAKTKTEVHTVFTKISFITVNTPQTDYFNVSFLTTREKVMPNYLK